jgi:hypothetical protein
LDCGTAAPLAVDDDEGGQAGHFVDLFGDGDAVFHVLELHAAGVLGDDGTGMGIPVGQRRAGLDHLAVHHRQGRAVGHFMAFALAVVVIGDDQLAVAGDGDRFTLDVGDVADGGQEADGTGRLAFQLGSGSRAGGGAADVEGPHGQLGAGLADGLGGDDADGLAGVDQITPAQVAAVTLGAQAPAGIAGQRRAHLDFVDAQLVNQVHLGFIEQGGGFDDGLAGIRD